MLASIAFNAWWWARDQREPTSWETIKGWIRQGRLDLAEASLWDRCRRSPNHGETRMLLARVLEARGDPAGAARQYRRVPAWWPTKPEALFLEGEASLKADRARDAEAAWKACLADDPLHPTPPGLRHRAARELAALSMLRGRPAEARAALERGGLAMPGGLESIPPPDPATAPARLRRFVAEDPGDLDSARALADIERSLAARKPKADPRGVGARRARE